MMCQYRAMLYERFRNRYTKSGEALIPPFNVLLYYRYAGMVEGYISSRLAYSPTLCVAYNDYQRVLNSGTQWERNQDWSLGPESTNRTLPYLPVAPFDNS